MKDCMFLLLQHILRICLLFVLCCLYFQPVIKGKSLPQGDGLSWKAMVNESKEYIKQTGDYISWNSSMFSGMPAYQIGGIEPGKNWGASLISILRPGKDAFGNTIGTVFFYLVGFYIALACLGLSPWLALFGALAFGLGSYNLIIIEAGHMTKAWCMALMMPIIAGLLLCIKGARDSIEKGKWNWWKMAGGAVLFALALNLQIACNHIQITYYTAIGCVVLCVVYLVYALKEKWFKPLMVCVALLLLGAAFAVGCNARHLIISADYAKYTMRGGSEISVKPENLYNDVAPQSNLSSEGLSIDYAYSWSYGVGETYTLLVPGAMGGGSGERVSKESACYQNFHQTQMPLYWGDQPFTSGPVYFGAIVCFLFVLGLFVVKGPERWWLLIATVLAILLSWGRNFMGLNEWLFYNLPLYNKFRTPSMSLTLANVTMVFMAVLAVWEIVKLDRGQNVGKKDTAAIQGVIQMRKSFNKALYWAGGITIGMLLIGLIMSGGFSYSGAADQSMAQQYGSQWSFIQNVFIQDRKALFVSDTWRSIVFVALAFGVLWLYVNRKISKSWIAIVALAALVTIDLWGVDKRYLCDENFVRAKDIELKPTQTDKDIDAMAAQYGDEDYRVFNMAVNTFNDAKPSAYHHQIGGYSAVKLRRYQDIIDFYLSYHINPNILNMLNARYVVFQQGQIQRNHDALGNAWFVDSCMFVGSPDDEILALNNINPAVKAIIDTSLMPSAPSLIKGAAMGVQADGDYIKEEVQKPYNPDYLKYNSHCSAARLAVFSEVYYAPDWFCYIDGKPAEYVRANYILRAAVIPAGDHVVEFRNEAPLMHRLDKVSVASSMVLLVVVAGVVVLYFVRRKKTVEDK